MHDDKKIRKTDRDTNPDPITGASGSHPVSTGVGAAAAGAAGAAIGSIVPGIGTAIGGAAGAIIGAVGGGFAGKAVGEAIDPTGTDDYWRDRYKGRDYAKSDKNYDAYRPAYQYGASLADRGDDSEFDDDAVRSEWSANPANTGFDYDSARGAIRDEYDRRVQLRKQKST